MPEPEPNPTTNPNPSPNAKQVASALGGLSYISPISPLYLRCISSISQVASALGGHSNFADYTKPPSLERSRFVPG